MNGSMIYWLVIYAAIAVVPIVLALGFKHHLHGGKVFFFTGSAVVAFWGLVQFVLTLAWHMTMDLDQFSVLDNVNVVAAVLLPVGVILLMIAAIRAGNSPKANQLTPGPAPLTPPAGPPASYPPPPQGPVI